MHNAFMQEDEKTNPRCAAEESRSMHTYYVHAQKIYQHNRRRTFGVAQSPTAFQKLQKFIIVKYFIRVIKGISNIRRPKILGAELHGFKIGRGASNQQHN